MNLRRKDRIQELLDRQDIWSAILRYARGVDRLDADLLRSCYWDDAVDDHHVYVGKAEAFAEWAIAAVKSYKVCHHAVSNHTCELDGDDAHSETYYVAIGARADPPHTMSMGRYIDHFQRRDGEWRIANRVCVIEKVFELHDHPLEAGILLGDTGSGPLPRAGRDKSDLSYQRPVAPRLP